MVDWGKNNPIDKHLQTKSNRTAPVYRIDVDCNKSYEPISIMECHNGFENVAHLKFHEIAR